MRRHLVSDNPHAGEMHKRECEAMQRLDACEHSDPRCLGFDDPAQNCSASGESGSPGDTHPPKQGGSEENEYHDLSRDCFRSK
jgi:hypothetical protein